MSAWIGWKRFRIRSSVVRSLGLVVRELRQVITPVSVHAARDEHPKHDSERIRAVLQVAERRARRTFK